MKLIVSDLDGTLLNEKSELSQENVDALLSAQKQGIEIAIASGRNYGNVSAICRNAGLNPHIISNNGSFVFTKEGERIQSYSLEKQHVRHAIDWLQDRRYFFMVCCAEHIYTPRKAAELLDDDYNNATNRSPEITEEKSREGKEHLLNQECIMFIDDFYELIERDVTFGNVSVITVDLDKLQAGRTYFGTYPGMSMTIAGKHIFEMIHTSASKGNALECLTKHLRIPLQETLAVGDNFNDLSMLKKAGISVAVENAEEEVKKICKHVTLANIENGVAHIINNLLQTKPLSQNPGGL